MVSKTLSILELLDDEGLYKFSDDLFNKFMKIATYEGMNPVRELELGEFFNANDVKQAFRRLARIYHPDVSNDPNAEEKFKKINHAYQMIMNRLDYYIKDNSNNKQENRQEHRQENRQENRRNDQNKYNYQEEKEKNDNQSGESWSETFKKQDQYQTREKRGLSPVAVAEIKKTIIDDLLKSQAFQEIYSTKLFYRYYQFLRGESKYKPDISHYRKVIDQALKKLKASDNIPLWWDHQNSQNIINIISGARYKLMPLEIAIKAVENILLSI